MVFPARLLLDNHPANWYYKKEIPGGIRICAVCCGVLLIIHRCVTAACLTGIGMLEAPAWHKK